MVFMCRSNACGGRRCPGAQVTASDARTASARYYARTKARATGQRLCEQWGLETAVDLDIKGRKDLPASTVALRVDHDNAARVEAMFMPPAHRAAPGVVWDESMMAAQGITAVWDERTGIVKQFDPDSVRAPLKPLMGDIPGLVTSRQGRFTVEDAPVRRVKDAKVAIAARLHGGLDTTERTDPRLEEPFSEASIHAEEVANWRSRAYGARAVIARDENGKVVASMMYIDELRGQYPDAMIRDVRTDPSFRGGGAGTAMIDAVKMRVRVVRTERAWRYPPVLYVRGAVATAKGWYAMQGANMKAHSSMGEFDLTPRGQDAPRERDPHAERLFTRREGVVGVL